MPGFAALETALRAALFVGIALLLLTPFIVTPETMFPFVVGKGMWSRSVIAVVFALWVVLALAKPRYRPPRSWLLLILGAGLAVSLLSATTGVSLQRSLWSTYERMQGVMDDAHWLALAVVLVSVLRTREAWRALLAGMAAVGAWVALLSIALGAQVALPIYSLVPPIDPPRLGGPLGNPTYLSAYLLVGFLAALGLAVRYWLAARSAATQREAGIDAPPRSFERAWRRVSAVWGTAAALILFAFARTGSVGGFAGLFASLVFLAAVAAWLGAGRLRGIAATALAVLALVAVAGGLRFAAPAPATAHLPDDTVARYVLSVHLTRPSVQSRFAAWEAGLEGFAARPLLGWGPENYIAVFGRYASGYGSFAQPHDQAHNKLVDVAATMGAAGLAAYLALWLLALVTVVRAAVRQKTPERVLALFVGAALVGHLALTQFGVETVTVSLQATLLLAFAAGLEATAFRSSRWPRLTSRLAERGAALLGRRSVRGALGAGAVAAAVAGLTANLSIYRAAGTQYHPIEPDSWEIMAGGIERFPPLANTYRWWLLNEMAAHWPRIYAEDSDRARHLIEWAGREAEQAARTDPAEWRAQHSAARMFAAAAKTDPEYAADARRLLARAEAAAPNRAVFPPELRPPHSLAGAYLADGRYELRWRWPEEATGYVAISESVGEARGRLLLCAYDPARTTLVLPEGRRPGTHRYRIKACWYAGRCSAQVEWPAVETNSRPADGKG